jgi:hypothetical protein
MIWRTAARICKDRKDLDPQLIRADGVYKQKCPRKARYELRRNDFGCVTDARGDVRCIGLRIHFAPIAILGVTSAKYVKPKLTFGELDLNFGKSTATCPFADEAVSGTKKANR